WTLANVASVLTDLGRLSEGRVRLDEALELHERRVSNPRFEALALALLAYIDLIEAKLADAGPRFERALDFLNRNPRDRFGSFILLGYAAYCWSSGDAAGARASVQRALDYARAMTPRVVWFESDALAFATAIFTLEGDAEG